MSPSKNEGLGCGLGIYLLYSDVTFLYPFFSQSDRIPHTIIIRRHPHILLEHRIHREPSRMGRIQVAGTVVVEPRLLIQFLRIEKVRGAPRTVALLDEDLAVRDVGHVLGDLTVDVRNEGGGYLLAFSPSFPWGWHGFVIVSDGGLTRRALFYSVPINRLVVIYSFRILQVYNFFCGSFA